MRKIYISGKITGDSGYIEKFKAVEKEIRQQYKGCEGLIWGMRYWGVAYEL